MTGEQAWLDAMWPFVRTHLPIAPASVLEIGCGPLGGFVPELRNAGYQAVGVDPEAPDAPPFHRFEFERYAAAEQVDAVVASLSLHHVADPAVVLDQVVDALRPGGTVVVIEWARERFDESTARWCFARLPQPPAGEDGGWLARRRVEWAASGQSWDTFREAWARRESMHTGREVLDALDRRFQRQSLAVGPYFFPDLTGTTAADEQAAIDAGTIQATCLRYVGRRR
ncbi:MAG TPA: class I SAM-dependent methyltransferase [Micromonosporaceae bacterium]|nr:class I SAM-dependent methyltransferase [Micromonosporaceae bacterium]